MSDDNIAVLPVVTNLDLPAERVLDRAIAAGLTEVVVLGYDKDGQEYFASSQSDGGSVLWHLERAKLKLLSSSSDDTRPPAVNPEGRVLPFVKPGPDR